MNDLELKEKDKPAAARHCLHRTPSGRCCRMPVSDPASGFCFRHAAARRKERDTATIAAKLIGDAGEFTCAVVINRSLGELYKLLARDEIAPRRAAVMAYTCNLLVRTLPAIERELHPRDQQDDQGDHRFIMDIPSAVANRAAELQRARYKDLASPYGSYCTPASSDSPGDSSHSTVSTTETSK